MPPPAGVRLFDAAEARSLNQCRAFVLRMDVLAKVPVSAAWFPDLARPGQAVIAVVTERLREELNDLAANLVRRRRDLIQMRGV